MISFLSSMKQIGGGDPVRFNLFPTVIPRNGQVRMDHEFTSDELKSIRIEVVDVQGKLVQTLTPVADPIVLEGIGQAGFYLVQAVTENGRIGVAKLVVQ